ncbi:MAG: hypothetical protein M0P47_00510 [Bacteroidales bacterium]|nr:hypothetical protein [Bacteroidales bacterium]
MIQTVINLSNMNKPEISSDWIDRYVANELNETEKELFQKSLQVNSLLRAELSVDQALNELLSDKEAMDFYEKLQTFKHVEPRTRKINPLLLIAASVIALFSIGLVFFLEKSHDHPFAQVEKAKTNLETSNPSTSLSNYWPAYSPLHGEIALDGRKNLLYRSLLAENCSPLPEFESLIGQSIRSFPLKLISPQVNIRMHHGEKIVFLWEKNFNEPEIIITIMDNEGREIHEIQIVHDNQYKFSTDDLRIGLYYWKITIEDNFVMMGKILLF